MHKAPIRSLISFFVYLSWDEIRRQAIRFCRRVIILRLELLLYFLIPVWDTPSAFTLGHLLDYTIYTKFAADALY